jgi:tRNA pseudouridine55 synthase
VLLIGQATRIARFLELEPKEYIAEALFGITTDTQDITGNVIQKSDMKVDVKDIEALLPQFTGEILQTPPMVSAVKIGGKTLYKLARQGKEVERPKRKVAVYELELLEFFKKGESTHALFRVLCSSGTYVRTLVHDMGERLGAGATLASLRRTRVGRYSLSDALTLGADRNIKDIDELKQRLLSIDAALAHLAEVVALNSSKDLILNGRWISLQELKMHAQLRSGQQVRIKSEDGALLAIGQVRKTDGFIIKPEVVFKV